MHDALPGTLMVLAVGRLALACLPPGWPGDHGRRELAATAAASFLCGLTLLAAQAGLLLALGLEPGLSWLVAPWASLLVLRVVTLPGAMRPRHEPPGEATDRLGRIALWLLGALGLAVPLVLTYVPAEPAGPIVALERLLSRGSGGTGQTLARLTPAALAILVAGGLERGRRGPLQRALVFAAVAWLPGVWLLPGRGDGSAFAALGLVAAGAGAIAWLRRADRRALALSWLGLGASALLAPAGWAPAGAGLVWLVLATPRASRRTAALGGGASLAVALLARGTGGPWMPADLASTWALAPAALLLLGQTLLRAERPAPDPAPSAPPPRSRGGRAVEGAA